jgi:hypothetical protein
MMGWRDFQTLRVWLISGVAPRRRRAWSDAPNQNYPEGIVSFSPALERSDYAGLTAGNEFNPEGVEADDVNRETRQIREQVFWF